jgi:hypothetical protein
MTPIDILAELRGLGMSDAQVAVFLSDYLPGGVHPSTMSVYRWRTGRSAASPIYREALSAFFADHVGGKK